MLAEHFAQRRADRGLIDMTLNRATIGAILAAAVPASMAGQSTICDAVVHAASDSIEERLG
jgi:hypothetical protein